MDIQDFRHYLQDATNFFTVLEYDISDVPYKNKDKKFLNWFFDPFKETVSEFFVSENSFIIRKVVDKNKASIISVFDAVVRYFSFCDFVEGDSNIKLAATRTDKMCFLVANINNKVHTLAGVRLYYTRTKAVIESVVLSPDVIEKLRDLGITHRDPEVLEVLGNDDVPHILEEEDPEEKAFLSRRFMFDEISGTNEDGDIQSTLVIKTARQILDEYWLFWSEQMRSKWADKEHLVTFENCINDYCVVNWAWEVDANGNKI